MVSRVVKENEQLVETYDMQGRKTDELVPRGQLHTKGIPHANVGMLALTPERKGFFQIRGMNKNTFPGALTLTVCGHTEKSETALQALGREVKKGLGLPRLDMKRLQKMTINPEREFDNYGYFEMFGFIALNDSEEQQLLTLMEQLKVSEKQREAEAINKKPGEIDANEGRTVKTRYLGDKPRRGRAKPSRRATQVRK